MCGKLVIEQIFITCQALLAGLSLYPLIAAYAGNVNSEEFVSGYGPGARLATRSVNFDVCYHPFMLPLLQFVVMYFQSERIHLLFPTMAIRPVTSH